jgi:predicted transposase YbfD/YdcC
MIFPNQRIGTRLKSTHWYVRAFVMQKACTGLWMWYYDEDKRIVHKDNGTQNLAVLKRMALNIIRANDTLCKE